MSVSGKGCAACGGTRRIRVFDALGNGASRPCDGCQEPAPDTGWRDRAPTAGEVRAHAKAHPLAAQGDPSGLWVQRPRLGYPRLWRVRAGAEPWAAPSTGGHWRPIEQTGEGEWRPATADVMPAAWPVVEGV